MNRSIVCLLALGAGGLVSIAATSTSQGEDKTASAIPAVIPPAAPVFTLEDNFIQWPLPSDGDKVYGAIDGKQLHRYVVDQAMMARKYRDTVNPQFWGRITGTSADKESADWMIAKFKQFGLSDVRAQALDLPPQWFPEPYTVTATSGGRTLQLDKSATPAYGTMATPAAGLEVDAVWVGTGTEADYIGKDVRGKAVFILSTPLPGSMLTSAGEDEAVVTAETHGAAAAFQVITLPGNMRNVLYPNRVKMPVFALGMEDGFALRDMIGKAKDTPARVKIQMQTKRVPNLKSELVWGTLPGVTDETIYILAHRDGWFDAATDNASGVATLLGLAEYFAKVPKEKRQRTMIFIGLDGHHNDGGVGDAWLVKNKDKLFAKTALMINAEHTSTIQTYLYAWQIRRANTNTAMMWYAGGPSRPKLQRIAVDAFKKFGVAIYAEPERAAPLSDLSAFYRFVPGVDAGDYNMFFHSDQETPETVPWTGLESATRAYAKIVDEVNKLPLSDLQRPEEPAGKRPCAQPRAECYSGL